MDSSCPGDDRGRKADPQGCGDMGIASPLRYPGGKSAMAGLLNRVRVANQLRDRDFGEPYAGGAGAALTLLFRGEAPAIHINDADEAIADIWWAVLERIDQFSEMIYTAPLTLNEWRRQRAIYRDPGSASRLERAFSAFYLNRCNRSGIIRNGGPIGGIQQTGKWRLDARFNREGLVTRCQRVARQGSRIHLSALDGIDFLQGLAGTGTFLFIDPPYFGKGPTLYLNALDPPYHAALARALRTVNDSPWVLTYDNCPEVRVLYEDWAAIRSYSLRYSASSRRRGGELLIAPRWMILPTDTGSASIRWHSA